MGVELLHHIEQGTVNKNDYLCHQGKYAVILWAVLG